MRLRSRFTLLFGVLAAGAAVFLMLLLDRTVRRLLEDRARERVRLEAQHLVRDVDRMPVPPAELDAFLREAARDLSARVTLVDPDGRVTSDTDLLAEDVARMESHADRPEIREARLRGSGSAVRFSATEGHDRLYVAQRRAGGGVLRVSVAMETLRQTELPYLWTARGAIALVCLGLFLIGWAASRRLSEPITRLTEAALAIAAGDERRQIPMSGGEEAALLGASLQRMRKALERETERSEAERRLAAIVFEQLPDGLVVVDARLRVIESNARFARMAGIAAPAGRALYDVLRHRGVYELFEKTIETKEPSERTIRLGDEIVWQVTVVALPAGSRAAAVGAIRDVTRVERTESMRRTFVADVSHELRTPIASIAAAAETLADGEPDEPERDDLVALIVRQSERMRELLSDLMDLSQIESGGVELEREEVVLADLLRELAGDLAGPAVQRKITLRIVAEDPGSIIGDRRRIGQILRNLLDNAIKFSPEGGTVTLRAAREGTAPVLEVSDEGPGIPRAEQERIFQRFYQLDRSRSKTRPGTGLGLAIVKHLAQLHGAVVEVDSEPGRGSTFRVRFGSASLLA
jgi:two-component system phosphate regulon sensor histidine kinase PhoR